MYCPSWRYAFLVAPAVRLPAARIWPVKGLPAVQVEDGYGYIVLHGSDTLIYQPYIPAVSGHQPFTTEEDALKTGKLVCRKLDEGQPPTLSREEVKSCLTDTGLYHDKDQCLSR